MKSVLPFCTGTIYNTYTITHLETPPAHPKWITNSKLAVTTTTTTTSSQEVCVMNRRQALGNGFSFACLHLLIHHNNSAAAAAAAADCEFTVVPSGLAYCDKVVGTGPQAIKGQLIKAHYVGRLEDGKLFDSSYNRGKPLTFRVGVGEVIKGWDEGIVGGDGIPPMLVGGKRKLRIPPQLGYGIRGAGCRGGSCIIPPDSVLLFDVEFVGEVVDAGGR